MNLILQGPNPDRAAIDRIAALARARRLTPIDAHAWRCEDVHYSTELKTEVDAACLIQPASTTPSCRPAAPSPTSSWW